MVLKSRASSCFHTILLGIDGEERYKVKDFRVKIINYEEMAGFVLRILFSTSEMNKQRYFLSLEVSVLAFKMVIFYIKSLLADNKEGIHHKVGIKGRATCKCFWNYLDKS